MRSRRVGFALRAANERTQARREFVEIRRLDEIVVGAGIEPAHAILDRVARGENEDRQPQAARTNPLQHLEAREPRQAQVEDDRCIAACIDRVQRGHAVADPVHLEAGLRESRLEAVAEQGIVFDEEESHRGIGGSVATLSIGMRLRRRT